MYYIEKYINNNVLLTSPSVYLWCSSTILKIDAIFFLIIWANLRLAKTIVSLSGPDCMQTFDKINYIMITYLLQFVLN